MSVYSFLLYAAPLVSPYSSFLYAAGLNGLILLTTLRRVAAALCLFFTSEGGSGDRKRGISQICCNGLVGLRRRGSFSRSVSFGGRVILGSDSFKGCILHLVSSRNVLCFTGVGMYASGWLWSLAAISSGMYSSMTAVFLEAIGCLDLVETLSSLLLSCLLCIVYTLQRAERE